MALEKAKLYLRGGEDTIFPEVLESIDEFKMFVEELKAPILANMTEFGRTPYIKFERFRDAGVKFVIYPVTVFRANAKNAVEIYTLLKQYGGQEEFLDKLMERKTFYEYINYKEYEKYDKELSKWG